MTTQKFKKYIPENSHVDPSSNMAVFEVPVNAIVETVRKMYADEGLSLTTMTATDERNENGCFKVWYVFGAPKENIFIVPFVCIKNTDTFPSVAPFIHEAWNYERKIAAFFGLDPVGHPKKAPVTVHENWPHDVFPLRKDFNWQTRPPIAHGKYEFQKVEGEGIYEISVGPIHAGIIEPGHFRFSVAGEEIMLLEPRLGYTHKGSEKLFEVLPLEEKVRLSEKISGDSSFSHSLAFSQAVERLADIDVPERALYMRTVYAELERLANHFGDIGAIMLDTGFNFGGAHGARLREMIMQINEKISGSRFLRGINTIGGVARNITPEMASQLIVDCDAIMNDFSDVIAVAEKSSSLINRLKETGTVPYDEAKNHGVIGVAGKAVGIGKDARIDHPYAAYDRLTPTEIPLYQSGDVYARFRVRIEEAYTSHRLIVEALKKLPDGAIVAASRQVNLKKDSVALGIVEGWRGTIVYFLKTDKRGELSRVDVRDPSFLNWTILGYAGKGNMVPDFPLVNKSFNLSYTGNDL